MIKTLLEHFCSRTLTVVARHASLLLVASVLLAHMGCAKRYYVAEYVFHRKDVLPPLHSGDLQVAALDSLVQARTIAFAPPSSCNDIVAGGGRTAAREDLLSSDCGALMSELESAAQAAGFTVISWKSLKTPVEQHAKQSGVDLLVEVNRLAIHQIARDMYVTGRINFYEENTDGQLRKLEVEDKQKVGDLCEAIAPFPAARDEVTLVLDAKLIDTSAGQVLWRQVHMLPSREEGTSIVRSYYYARSTTSPERVLCRRDRVEPSKHRIDRQKKAERAAPQSGASYDLRPLVREHGSADLLSRLVRESAHGLLGTVVAIRDVYAAVAKLPPSSNAARRMSGASRTAVGVVDRRRGAEAASLYKRGVENQQLGRLDDAAKDLTATIDMADKEHASVPDAHFESGMTAARHAAELDEPERTQKCQAARHHLEIFARSVPEDNAKKRALQQRVESCGKKLTSLVDPT